MDPVWVVLAVLVGALLFLGAMKRSPRDDQRRIPYKPDPKAPAMPPGFTVTVFPDASATPPPAARPKPEIFDLSRPASLRLVYIDAQGEDTEREVIVKSFTVQSWNKDGRPSHLRGHCHLRNGSRAFTLTRIEEAFDMRDGSEIRDVAAWLLEQPSRRRPRDLDL